MSIEFPGLRALARVRRLRLGIALRATLLTLAIAFTAFLACSVYIHTSQTALLRQEIEGSMSSLSGAAARSIGNWLRGKLDLMQLVAEAVADTGVGPAADRVLDAPTVRRGFYVDYIARTDGFFTKMPKAPIPPGYDPRTRPWFKDVAATKSAILTEPYISASRGSMVLTAAAPVADAQRKLVGVAAGDFDVGALARMIADVVPGGNGYAYLVSGAGKILIHPKDDLVGKPLSDLIDGAKPDVAAGRGIETREAGRATLTVFARVPDLPSNLDWYVALSFDRAAAVAPIHHLTRDMAVATVILLLALAIAVSRTMATTVARPLNRLVRVLQRMNQGELDTEIAEARRHDEIGLVGRAVEGIKILVAEKARERAEVRRLADAAASAERRRTMTELADAFERVVGTIASSVSSAAADLHATAETLTVTATQAAAQSSGVAAAAEEASANVRTVAAAAEQLGTSVQEVAGQVAGSTRLARTAVDEADETGRRVQDLSEAVSKIGDAVGLISSIAAQTNLLALNATIEAARAGEAGRGFAVVAAEVKELAAQTARATEEITGHIARVQGSTGEAARALDGIVARIRDINDVATAVSAAVSQQDAATREIAQNVSQASTGTEEVTTNIAGVAGAAAQTGQAAHRVLDSAKELSRQSDHLGVEVARFLASVRAA